jgi:hypothetical protein
MQKYVNLLRRILETDIIFVLESEKQKPTGTYASDRIIPAVAVLPALTRLPNGIINRPQFPVRETTHP